MAPVIIVEDYYLVLEVLEIDSLAVIVKSYKRLALRLHPDRNSSQNATEEFQALGRAYETLRDESKRRTYDTQHYPRIKKARETHYPTDTGNSNSGSGATTSKGRQGTTAYSSPETRNTPDTAKSKHDMISKYAAAISNILNIRQDRAMKWSKTRKVHDDVIFELTRRVCKLQTAIRHLEEIKRAEVAEAAAANSWTTWLLSPLYHKPVEKEEEKERKERDQLQRLHTKAIKQNALRQKEDELQSQRDILAHKHGEFLRANKKDDDSTFCYEELIRGIRRQAEQEKQKAATQEKDRIWREQQEKWQKEARERRDRQDKEAAEQLRRTAAQEAERKRQQEIFFSQFAESLRREEDKYDLPRSSTSKNAASPSTSHFGKSNCLHDGWWPKVEGRHTCERCSVSHYNFLLQCPGCHMLACASCQHYLRPPRRNINKQFPYTARQSQETFSYDDCYDFD